MSDISSDWARSTYGVGATKDVTGKTPKKAAKTTTAQPATTPKKTTSTLKTATGDKLSKTSTATKSTTPAQNLQLGLQDQLALNEVNNQADVQSALRLYQNEAAKQQLQNSLATINRSAIQQYQGIANDYAARGMVRSGGYMRANDQALATTNQQKIDAESAVRDFINQNQLKDVVQTGTKQKSLQDILVQLLSQFNTNNIGQLGL